MQSHMKFKDFVWNPVMVVKSVILVKGNMTASWWTKTNDGKCMAWPEIWDSMAANYAHNWPILRIQDGGNAKS
jgi:hypothetical protein